MPHVERSWGPQIAAALRQSGMLGAMSPTANRKPARAKPTAKRARGGEPTFPEALAALLRSRKVRVPAGLTDAPPQAYASQPSSYVERLTELGDEELRRYAEQIAGYARRQAKRARDAWEASPLIAELRRRRLKEPDPPERVVGASVSLSKPLSEWSDAEIVRAADEWSRMGRA